MPRLAGQQFGGIGARLDRPRRNIKPCLVGQFDDRLGARLQPGQGARQPLAVIRGQRPGEFGLQPLGDQAKQPPVIRLADVMRIDAVELGLVEARCTPPDIRDIEPLDRLLKRDDLLVAVAPAQAHQVIAQRFRQVAHLAVGLDADRTMPLRQLGAVRTMDQRHMREFGHRPVEGPVDLRLTKRIVQMVVAADHMGDAHVMVVGDDR